MKKKNILLKSAMGIGSIAAISTAAVAATSCSKTTTSYLEAHVVGSLTTEPTSETTVQVEAVGVTLPTTGEVETDLPEGITAVWQENGIIQLTNVSYSTAGTIEFTITVGEVSTTTSVTVVTPAPIPDPITHETLEPTKFYFDEEYKAAVDGCFRYEFGETPDTVEDWLVEYGVVDQKQNNYQFGNFINFEYLYEAQTKADIVIYGISQEEFTNGLTEIITMLSEDGITLNDNQYQQLLNGIILEITNTQNMSITLQFKILDNFYYFSNKIATFPSIQYQSMDLCDLTIRNVDNGKAGFGDLVFMAPGTKLVFDYDKIYKNADAGTFFNIGAPGDFRLAIGADGASDLLGVQIYQKYGVKEVDDQTYDLNNVSNYGSELGGKFIYTYGANGEDWSTTFKIWDANGYELSTIPESFRGYCTVYEPSWTPNIEFNKLSMINAGILANVYWQTGLSAADHNIEGIQFNLDTYFSQFTKEYGLSYYISPDEYINFWFNQKYESGGWVLSPGNIGVHFKLKDHGYGDIDRQFSIIDNGEWAEMQEGFTDFGGLYTYTLGAWGESKGGKFYIIQEKDDETVESVTPVWKDKIEGQYNWTWSYMPEDFVNFLIKK